VSVYADYNPEEQQLLRKGVQSAAVAVSAASPGRKEETVSEGVAAATLVLDSQAAYVGNTLVTSIIVDVQARIIIEQPFPDFTKVASAPGAQAEAMDAMRAVVALLAAKTDAEEAAGYKTWLMQVATATAQAGKEDQGFLGRGGVKVNDAERAVLAEIAEILGIES
jgi:hypothetical protein